MKFLDFAKKEEESQGYMYTEEQLMARLKFFIGICLSVTLTGIVFVVLYSLIFVTQPLNAISPIDQKFFELIVPIATFLTGTLSGIMLAGTKKEDQDAFLAAQKQAQVNAEAARVPITPMPAQQSIRPMSMPTMPIMPVVTPTMQQPDQTINIKMTVPMAPQPEI